MIVYLTAGLDENGKMSYASMSKPKLLRTCSDGTSRWSLDEKEFHNVIFTFEMTNSQAEEVAILASSLTGNKFVAVSRPGDKGPLFVRVPKIGEHVSQGFNGDYYYVGIVKESSATKVLVERDDGSVVLFKRSIAETGYFGQSSSFVLVSGIKNERNPSF